MWGKVAPEVGIAQEQELANSFPNLFSRKGHNSFATMKQSSPLMRLSGSSWPGTPGDAGSDGGGRWGDSAGTSTGDFKVAGRDGDFE